MPSFGELLKRERELRKISLREVSEATKINLRYLEAMERNDFRHLPGGVFNKGFVRAFAQYIGVDPEGMINAYLLEQRKQEDDHEPAPEGDVLRGRGSAARPAEDREAAPRTRRGWWVVVAVLAGLAVIVVLWLVLGPSATESTPVSEREAGTPIDSEPAGAGPVSEPPEAKTPSPEASDPGEVAGEGAGSPAPSDRDPARDDAAEPPREAATERIATVPAAPPETVSPDSGRPGPSSGSTGRRDVRVIVTRATSGRIVCDRRVEMLDGRVAGTELQLRCSVLLIETRDGGAVHVGVDAAPPVAIGPDGESVSRADLLANAGREGSA